jgi:regulator of sigma E protease
LKLSADGNYAGLDLSGVLEERAESFVDPLANPWGIYPSMVFIEKILEDSASEEAGLREGARIMGIDGVGIATWNGITGRISEKQVGEGSEASAKPVQVLTVHQGKAVTQQLTPRITKDTDGLGRYRYRAMIGIGGAGEWVNGPMSRKYFGASESVSMAFRDTKMLVVLTVSQIGKLLSGQASPSKSLGGPVQIFRDAGAAAKQGAHTWWRLMAVLSISLAIVNFLPVPVLDGGQFLFFLVEGIRGRPVSLRFRERAQQVGVLLLVALMLMVLVIDIGRIFGKS